MSKCTRIKDDLTHCLAQARSGTKFCRWHSRTPEDLALHALQSSLGGLARAGKYAANIPTTAALDADPAVVGLDLSTAVGIRELLGHTLRALTRLPVDVRLATCLGQLATAQKNVITESDFEHRLEQLEAQQKKAA